MIHEDLYWEGGTMKVVAPGFQGTNDREEFPVVDVIVAFSRGKRL